MERFDLERREMSNTGNTILKGISPIEPMLDLFVRESIQNSYDAMLANKKFLKVEFNCGEFDVENLSDLFDGISSGLKTKSKSLDNSHYISVRDYNATGLVGPLLVKDVVGLNWGKFLNLVRNFGKSQKEAGAGGSWGYGKTTFYKMGLGIVIYYSRILNDNKYEERLMACIVENENNKDGLLYNVQEGKNTGIAWWGKLFEDNILPITDHDEIMGVLNCFNLKPYEEDETGTAVIIPYINKIKLLNQTSSGDFDSGTLASWSYNIEDYLKMSFQKWYPTKCDNTTFRNKGIEVFINGNKVEKNRMRPLFKVVQSMYNKSLDSSYICRYDINEEVIRYKVNPPFNSSTAGVLYYVLLDEEELGMTVPNNEPSPYTCATNEKDDGTNKKVIMCFCRKPGMILKYDIDGDWSSGIVSPDPNKYLIGLFIPNSNNQAFIDGLTFTIDDYLRASESAEHNNWKDITEYTDYNIGKKIDCSKIRLVSLIHRRMKNIFDGLKSENVEELNDFVGSSLNRKLAELFLPKSGFGHRAKKEQLPNLRQVPKAGRRKAKLELHPAKVDGQNFCKRFSIAFNKSISNIDIEFKIYTENKDISIIEWEKLFELPFEIKLVRIDKILFKDFVKIIDQDIEENYSGNYFSYKKLKSPFDNQYGFNIKTLNSDVIGIEGEIVYKVIDSTIPISIKQGKGE